MAKKVILKDLDNVEILPITRGELIVDSSGKEAFHSNEFLATNSLPGLMSPEEKTKLSNIEGNIIDSTLSTTSTNPVQNKVVTVAINETKQLANDALETANEASENVSKVQQIINSIKANYLKSATVNGNVLTIVDLSDSEITFTNTTYNTFLKETAANTGGRNGLVPKPNYNDGSKTRFLREDGTWVIPSDTHWTTHLYVGAKDAASNALTTNGNTYIKVTDNSTIRNQYIIKGSGRTAVTSDASGNITITSPTVTWGEISEKPSSFTPSTHNHPTSQINALTNYTKATSAATLATTDSLNTALGKLEYKLDIAYDLVTKANDSDGTIENLKEILDVLADIKDTETIKAIIGKYLPLAGGTMTLGEGLKFHADENYFGTNLDARIISLLDGNGTICDGGLIIDERATSGGVEYVTELLRIRHEQFLWKGNTIWHAGNDGSGSGLDADLLDGKHASDFATSDHLHYIGSTRTKNDTTTQSLTGLWDITLNRRYSDEPYYFIGSASNDKTTNDSYTLKISNNSGDISSLYLVNGNIRSESNLLPFADKTYSLGSSTACWNGVYTKGVIYAYRYSNGGSALPFITFDKPGNYATGIGPDGTTNRIKFGPSDMAGSAWIATNTFNSNEWYFLGLLTTSNHIHLQYTNPILKFYLTGNWGGSISYENIGNDSMTFALTNKVSTFNFKSGYMFNTSSPMWNAIPDFRIGNSNDGTSNYSYVWTPGYINIGSNIGVANPGRAELTVISRSNVPVDIYLGNSGKRYWSITSREGDTPTLNIYNSTNGHIAAFTHTGRFGIGTTDPLTTFHANGDVIIGSKSKYYQRSARGLIHHEFVCDDSDYGGVKITHNSTEGSGGPGSYTASLFVLDNRIAHHSGAYLPTVYIQRAGATRQMDPFGIDVGSRVFTVGNDGKVTIGARISSSISAESAITRATIIPYFHTGGPWYIKSKDDPSNAFLTIDYDTIECLRIKHDGEVKVSKSLWINNSHFFKLSGTTFTCQGGTTFTLPSSGINTNTALLWTTASDGARDTGIFYNSSDFAFIANSNDHGAVFAVYDTDVTQDFEAGAREISVPGGGGALWARGGFSKSGSSNDYVLLGGGGHKAESSLSVNYATSAGNATTAISATYVTSPYSGYNRTSGTITDSTTSDSMQKAYNGALYPVFHTTDWGWSDTLYWSAYEKWGGTELATQYNAGSNVRVKIRKYNQSLSNWGSWTEFITSGNIGSQSVNYANSAGSVAWGNITGKPSSFIPSTHYHNYFPENTAVYFRDPSNSSWRGGMIWGSAGSESMSFVVINGGTRFQFVGGSDITNWNSSTWQSANPYLTIYSSGIVTPGSATASGGFVKSGYNDNYVLLAGGGHKAISDFSMAHSHPYLPTAGGTMSGAINLSNANAKLSFGSLGTSPITGYKAPSLGSSGVGIYSRYGGGSDEGAIIITEDTCVIYNSADTGWNFQVMDKDLGTDMTNDATRSFGINQNHQAWSLAGFVKSGSSDSYVLLGGGGHKLESNLSVSYAASAGAANSVAWANVTGKPTIPTNTWRGIVDNLTSTSTTESLTANMGRVLANGLSNLPVVLLAGTLYRASAGTTSIWHFTGIRHRSVSTTDPSVYVSGGVARFDFTANSDYSFSIYGVCVNHQASGDAPNYTSTEYAVRGAGFFWFGAYASGRSVYIRAICQGNSNNDSSYSNAPLWNSYGDGVTRMQIIAVGYAY